MALYSGYFSYSGHTCTSKYCTYGEIKSTRWCTITHVLSKLFSPGIGTALLRSRVSGTKKIFPAGSACLLLFRPGIREKLFGFNFRPAFNRGEWMQFGKVRLRWPKLPLNKAEAQRHWWAFRRGGAVHFRGCRGASISQLWGTQKQPPKNLPGHPTPSLAPLILLYVQSFYGTNPRQMRIKKCCRSGRRRQGRLGLWRGLPKNML